MESMKPLVLWNVGEPLPARGYMKIAVLTNYQLEQIGGAEEALDTLARLWHEAGHDVVLLCPRPTAKRRKRRWSPAYRHVRIPRPLSTRYFLGRYVRYLRREHRRGRLDVVLASDSYWPGHVARMFWLQTGVPYVVYSHGSDVKADSRFLRRPRIARRISLALRDAAASACISNYVRRRQAELATPGGIVRLIPNGWPDEWEKFPIPEPVLKGTYVFAMGRLVEAKGFQTLVEAYDVLRTKHLGVGLVIAGDGPYRTHLIARSRCLGLNPRENLPHRPENAPGVFFPGFVQGNVKRALLCHATLAVSPSICQEAMSLVLFEMLCSGVPVIGSEVGGTPDIVRPGVNGELFRAGDCGELNACLDRLLSDESYRAKLASGARPSVEPHRWSKVAQAYLELFEGVRTAAGPRAHRTGVRLTDPSAREFSLHRA
jgi:glycosyltransferase involved in cell wall biosynthesis